MSFSITLHNGNHIPTFTTLEDDGVVPSVKFNYHLIQPQTSTTPNLFPIVYDPDGTGYYSAACLFISDNTFKDLIVFKINPTTGSRVWTL